MSEAECDGCSCVTAYQKRKKHRIWHFMPHFQTLFCHFASPEYASGGNSRQMLHKHQTFLFTAGRHRLCCLVTTPTGVPTLVGTRHLSHNSTFQPQSYTKLLKAKPGEKRLLMFSKLWHLFSTGHLELHIRTFAPPLMLWQRDVRFVASLVLIVALVKVFKNKTPRNKQFFLTDCQTVKIWHV